MNPDHKRSQKDKPLPPYIYTYYQGLWIIMQSGTGLYAGYNGNTGMFKDHPKLRGWVSALDAGKFVARVGGKGEPPPDDLVWVPIDRSKLT